MDRGLESAAWDKLSALLAFQANMNRDPSKKPSPFKSADFSPFDSKGNPIVARPRSIGMSIKELGEAIVPRKKEPTK